MIETQGTRSRAPPEQSRALKTQMDANQWSIENEPKGVPVSTSELHGLRQVSGTYVRGRRLVVSIAGFSVKLN